MLRPTSHALVLLSLCLVAACRTVPNADYCEEDQECRNVQGQDDWVCDLTQYRCKEPSVGEECQDDLECGPDAPICGTDSKCRLCENSGECEARDEGAMPICSSEGKCVAGCSTSDECSGNTPICNTEIAECEGCSGNDVCAELGKGTPYCSTADPIAGACVACVDDTHCTASPEAPVCGEGNVCRGCKDHAECDSSVCDRGTGACVAESAVAYVAEGGTGDCSRAAPCGTIDAALALVEAAPGAKYIVRLDGGTYTEQVAPGAVTVRIIGDKATIQLGSGTTNVPVVNVGAGTDLTLEGVTIRGASNGTNADGINCVGSGSSSVQVLQSIITGNADLGIDAFQCRLTVARSAITNNLGGGIQVTSGAFDVTNSFILDNGDVRTSVVAGVRIQNAQTFSPQRFAFNTVAGNEASPDADAGGVYCDISATSSAIATSNVILEGFGGKPAVGGDCRWVYSAIEGKDGADIDDVIVADPNNIDSNCGLTDRDDGLQAVSAGSPCADAGQGGTGIAVDYDDNARSDTAPDMGADELAP